MKLSTAIRENVRFQISRVPGGGGKFLPFQGCVTRVFPDATADMFPLAFSCPLFVGLSKPATATVIVDKCLPEGAKLPQKPGIYFLCDAIDCMAVKLQMSESQVADIVELIEKEFERAGLDEHGLRCA
jgi:hypothetical protein